MHSFKTTGQCLGLFGRTQPIQNSARHIFWRGLILQKFGHTKLLRQDVGQPHPWLKFFALHHLPTDPVHVVSNDHGLFEQCRFKCGRAAGNERDIASRQGSVRLSLQNLNLCSAHLVANAFEARLHGRHGRQHKLQIGLLLA